VHSHLLRCVPALCRTGVKGHPGGAAVFSHTDLMCDMLCEYLHARPALKVALVVAGDVFSQPTIIVLGAEAVSRLVVHHTHYSPPSRSIKITSNLYVNPLWHWLRVAPNRLACAPRGSVETCSLELVLRWSVGMFD